MGLLTSNIFQKHASELAEYNNQVNFNLLESLDGEIGDDLKVALIEQSAIVNLFGTGKFVSPVLEMQLLGLANKFPIPSVHYNNIMTHKQRWLHVATTIYSVGGHTAFMKRWIENSKHDQIHKVVLLDQKNMIPESFTDAVVLKGGNVNAFPNNIGKLEKAQTLRNIAWADADIVVLHTHPNDSVPVIAFGVPGGPPVLLFNHSDHTFWLGATIADSIINFRESSYSFNRQYRGIDRNLLLPLPVPNPTNLMNKNKARDFLGISQESFIFLTVGRSPKYEPLPGLDFPKTAEVILNNCNEWSLIAVGPELSGDWVELKEKFGERLIIPGNRTDLTPFYQSADIYLEGFPVSSATSLLEAASSGLPIVRAPQQVPFPYYMDDLSLEGISRPSDCHEYILFAIELTQNEGKRLGLANLIQKKVINLHCLPNWTRNLDLMAIQIPHEHKIYPIMPFSEIHFETTDELYMFKGGYGFEKNGWYEELIQEMQDNDVSDNWINEKAKKNAKRILERCNRICIIENLQFDGKRNYLDAIQYFIENPKDYKFLPIFIKSLIPRKTKNYLRTKIKKCLS